MFAEQKETLFKFGRFLIKLYIILMSLYTIITSIIKKQIYFDYNYYLITAIFYLIFFMFAIIDYKSKILTKIFNWLWR